MLREEAHRAHNWTQVYCGTGCERAGVASTVCNGGGGSEGDKGGEAGPREPQARARGRGWGDLCQPYPEIWWDDSGNGGDPGSWAGSGSSGLKGSHVGEGMALAKGFVLLGVESLSFQVDLTNLGTAGSSHLGLGVAGRAPS